MVDEPGGMITMIRTPEVGLLIGLSFMLLLLPILFPVGGLFLTTFAPFPLIVLAIKYPWRYTLYLLVSQGILLFILGGGAPLLFFGQYALVPLAIAGAIRRGCSISQTMAVSVLLTCGAATLLLLGASVVLQQSPKALLTGHLEQVRQVVQEHLQMLGPTRDGEPATGTLEALPRLLLSIFPAMLMINMLFTNLLNYVLVRSYCQRGHEPILLAPARLALWSAPDHLVWIFLASGVALLLPFSPLSILGLNIFLITLALYLLQGVAIAAFWSHRLPILPGLRWMLAFLLFLVAGPLCIVVFTVVGLFDLWVDFRRQRSQRLVP